MAATKLNKTKYGDLLVATLPIPIETKEEHERMLKTVSRLMAKGEGNLSVEEERLLKLLVILVENFEDRTLPLKDASPHEMLLFFMDQRKLRQADLLPVFGSRSVASNVVNGKRSISKAQAKKLAEMFHSSADVFI